MTALGARVWTTVQPRPRAVLAGSPAPTGLVVHPVAVRPGAARRSGGLSIGCPPGRRS